MTEIDICIISWAKTPELEQVTKAGIESLLQSEDKDKIKFNIIVVESNENVKYDYPDTKTLYTKEPFNYNGYLNFAVQQGKSPYILLANSDLTYEKGWASNIIAEMEKNSKLLSASPFCPQLYQSQYFASSNTHYGYRVRVELNGWAIFQKRSIYEKIKELDTGVEFWFSDNILADQLIFHKIQHALVVNSVVNHHASNLGITGKTILDKQKMDEFTTGQHAKYLEASKKYIK